MAPVTAARVVEAIREQKRLVIAEEWLIMEPLHSAGTYQIPLRCTVPGAVEKPNITLHVEQPP